MTARQRLAALALILSACGGGKGYLDVMLTGDAKQVASLNVKLTLNGGAPVPSTYTLPSPTDLPIDFAITSAAPTQGTLFVSIAALDAHSVELASGANTGTLTEGAVTTMTIALTDERMIPDASPDVAVPRDLATPDLVSTHDLHTVDLAQPDLLMDDLARPDLLPACGLIGQPCCAASACNDGSVCYASKSGPRCISFAGAFAIDNTCNKGTCTVDGTDPLGGACACPPPFPLPSGSSQTFHAAFSCGGAGTFTSSATVNFCQTSKRISAGDWQGWYIQNGPSDCAPNTCSSPNAYNNGVCGCPDAASVEDTTLRIQVSDKTCNTTAGSSHGAFLHLCLRKGAAVTVAGAYQLDVDASCKGVPNPVCHNASANAQMCICPAGSMALPFAESASECTSATSGYIASVLYLCVIP